MQILVINRHANCRSRARPNRQRIGKVGMKPEPRIQGRSLRLSEQFLNHMPVHVSETAVDAVVADGELFVIDAQQME